MVGDLGSRTFATAREIKSTKLLRGMFQVVSYEWRTNDREHRVFSDEKTERTRERCFYVTVKQEFIRMKILKGCCKFVSIFLVD